MLQAKGQPLLCFNQQAANVWVWEKERQKSKRKGADSYNDHDNEPMPGTGPMSGSQSVQASSLVPGLGHFLLPTVAATGQSSRGNKVLGCSGRRSCSPCFDLWPFKMLLSGLRPGQAVSITPVAPSMCNCPVTAAVLPCLSHHLMSMAMRRLKVF